MKERIVIFGAGELGRVFLDVAGADYNVTAFADSDPQKQGQQIAGIPVIAPADIADFEYDVVMIANGSPLQSFRQLTETLGLPTEKVRCAPKKALSVNKSVKPFIHEPTREIARQTLQLLTGALDARHARYFTDFGTLLGLVRESDILKSDDDIDISAYVEDHQAVFGALCDIQDSLPLADEGCWTAYYKYLKGTQDLAYAKLWFRGHEDSGCQPFGTVVKFLRFEDDTAWQYNYAAPAHFFSGHTMLSFADHSLRAPHNYLEYLEYLYCDWRKPRRGSNVLDYQGYTDPRPVSVKTVLFG